MKIKELKQTARKNIRESKPNLCLIAFIFVLLILLLGVLSVILSGAVEVMNKLELYAEEMEEMTIEDLIYLIPNISVAKRIIVFALEVMMVMICVGFVLACQHVAKKEEVAIGNLMDGFSSFFRAIILMFLTLLLLDATSGIYVYPVMILLASGAGWAVFACIPLLFPVLYVLYTYRFSLFVLLENPGMPAILCMRTSRMLMKKHYKERILLDLSFVGWIILCMFPFVSIWVLPYFETTSVLYYEKCKAEFVAENGSLPVVVKRNDMDDGNPFE